MRMVEEAQIVARAFQDGVNPAERIFALARRMGYAAPAADAAEPSKGEAAATPNPAEAKLEAIAKGQRATPAMGGGGAKPKMTLASIAGMSDEEFDALDWDRTMRELTT